jgi:phosphate starvation-inducible PhoH-like protein
MKEKNGKNGHAQDRVMSSVNLVFDDNSLLPMLYGDDDIHLSKIEKKFNISASSRGNVLALAGEKSSVEASRAVLQNLYADLEKGGEVGTAQVDAAIRMAQQMPPEEKTLFATSEQNVIKTLKKTVKPYTPVQGTYIQALGGHDMVFALGPAGTGKTYIAVAMAVAAFMSQKVEKIILSRPAVEAGEKLGFLPGDLKEKIDPYLRPLYDALYDMMPGERLIKHMENGEIEVAPLAFMRGRTFSNSFVILDEAQNTTATQMKMFLTRMGENSRMVITGDLSQTDLPKDVKSGLGDAVRKLEGIEGIDVVRFTDTDVVRHPLAARIIQAYDEWDRKKKQ